MCYAMAIWVSFVSGVRRFACCSGDKGKRRQKYNEKNEINNNELEELEASNAEARRLLDEEKQLLQEQLNAANARIAELESQAAEAPPLPQTFAASTPKETRVRIEKDEKNEHAPQSPEAAPVVEKLDLEESNIYAECESLQWVVENLRDELATLRTKMNESILREEASSREVSKLASELQKSMETSERFNDTRSHCNDLQRELNESEQKILELERANEKLSQKIEQLEYKQSL
ncbi:Oidioi.mRNA.OKI2018_I69.XSR.g16826.t1.cds [Oikopleura dioica]|uniref:Oidioi.mRNA.OKI2018_I69.XSR.g16826.t1.cds n=1 Tax=Oikopleura dioica TaxID=34765 RepID=A0ABN7SHC6_OIKDI|nr:Oidioi.mRNA.OKI2018_I69.XSR.g16826.t1.cds [Oikopleura dioica]